MDTIAGSWQRIERALTVHSPASVKALRTGATDLELAAAERAIGRKLPADLRTSLRIHNGQAEPYMSAVLFDNEYLLSTTRIAETWKIRTDVLNELLSDVAPAPDGTVWWSPDLVPITDSNGSGFCVASRSGTIHYHTKDDTMSKALFASVEAWLANLADKLEAGRFTMQHGSPWLSD